MSGMKKMLKQFFGPSSTPASAPAPQSDAHNDDITAVLRNRLDNAKGLQEDAFAKLRAAASEAHDVAIAALRQLEDKGVGSRGRR